MSLGRRLAQYNELCVVHQPGGIRVSREVETHVQFHPFPRRDLAVTVQDDETRRDAAVTKSSSFNWVTVLPANKVQGSRIWHETAKIRVKKGMFLSAILIDPKFYSAQLAVLLASLSAVNWLMIVRVDFLANENNAKVKVLFSLHFPLGISLDSVCFLSQEKLETVVCTFVFW